MPNAVLHIALKSYLLRGAILEHELFSQLTYALMLPAEFEKALVEERAVKEVAKKRVVALEAEQNSSDSRWRWEMQMMDDMVKGQQGHRTKQSATIAKLKEEIGCLQQGIIKRDGQINYLAEEVESENRHRLEAQKCSRSDHLVAHNLKLDLEEDRSAHQATRATVHALEARRAFLESDAYEAEVVEKYRHGPVGKVEVSLAYKAGFDYLLALVPPESRPTLDSLYHSCVSGCLDLLKEIETKGGGLTLEVDDGSDDDDSEDDQGKAAPPIAPPALAVDDPEPGAALPSPTPEPGREE